MDAKVKLVEGNKDAVVARAFDKLSQWKSAKAQLDWYRAEERRLRDELVSEHSRVEPEYSGTENVSLFRGLVLKIIHRLEYKFDTDNAQVRRVLNKIADSVEGGHFTTDRLVQWKPSLVVGEYNKLPAKHRKQLDKILSVKPAAKSIELKD